MNLLSRTDVSDWLDALALERTLIAPIEKAGVLLYCPVVSSEEVVWRFTRPILAVKEFLFPQTERLLAIEKMGQEFKIKETFFGDEQVIFGVRPCDARGLKVLDAMFLENPPVDPYYARRREQTILIGLACREMGASCFCTQVGGRPDDAEGMDIMLYEVGDSFLVKPITDKGKKITAEKWSTMDSEQMRSFQADDSQPSPITPRAIAWAEQFAADYWQGMAERCLSCRICAYVCPTCRCFVVRDEALSGKGQFERIRCWDSCAGENYRRIAGGHRPRAEKGERLRNRFLCKFFYYPQQYGLPETVACTGCGRCIDSCPVNIDITEVMEHFV